MFTRILDSIVSLLGLFPLGWTVLAISQPRSRG